MDADTKQALEAMEARIMARFEQSDERVRDTETRLPSAFHGWSRPIEARMRNVPVIDERLGLLEERITALERKNLERGL